MSGVGGVQGLRWADDESFKGEGQYPSSGPGSWGGRGSRGGRGSGGRGFGRGRGRGRGGRGRPRRVEGDDGHGEGERETEEPTTEGNGMSDTYVSAQRYVLAFNAERIYC